MDICMDVRSHGRNALFFQIVLLLNLSEKKVVAGKNNLFRVIYGLGCFY